MADKDVQQVANDVNSAQAVPCAVPVRLAEFWQEEPALWFIQAEVQFRRGHVLDGRLQTDYLIASLQPATLKSVRDILTDVTAEEAILYTRLKERLVHRFAATISCLPPPVSLPPASCLPASCLLSHVSRLMSPVSFLPSPVSCSLLLSPVSHILPTHHVPRLLSTSPVSRLLSPVSCLLSPVSCLLSNVSCLTSSVSSPLSHISCLPCCKGGRFIFLCSKLADLGNLAILTLLEDNKN